MAERKKVARKTVHQERRLALRDMREKVNKAIARLDASVGKFDEIRDSRIDEIEDVIDRAREAFAALPRVAQENIQASYENARDARQSAADLRNTKAMLADLLVEMHTMKGRLDELAPKPLLRAVPAVAGKPDDGEA